MSDLGSRITEMKRLLRECRIYLKADKYAEYPHLIARIDAALNAGAQTSAAAVTARKTEFVAPAPHRRVVCAAIRAADGHVLLGVRHYSSDMRDQIFWRNDGHKFKHRHDEDQGFVDQHGVYMSREEAYQVALAARQIIYPERCGEGLDGKKLYSEGLY